MANFERNDNLNDFRNYFTHSYSINRWTEDGGGRRTDGGRRTTDDGRRTKDGGRRTEDGGRTADDGRRTANNEGRTTKGERFPVVEISRFPITCAKYFFLTLQLPEIMNK